MKMTKRAICLLLAAVMALALTIPVVAADAPDTPVEALADMPETTAAGDTITLHAGKDGSVKDQDVYVITATDNKLPELPTPNRTGWNFVGWYTGEVTEEFQDKKSAAPDYWTWIVTPSGRKVEAGQSAEGVKDLYAMYLPTTVEYKMYPCGWKNEFAALTVTRQYDTPFDPYVFGWNAVWDVAKDSVIEDNTWSGRNGDTFTFDGWFTSENNSGQNVTDAMCVGRDFKGDVYMHWHSNDNSMTQADAIKGFDSDKTAQYVWFDGKVKSKNIHVGDEFELTVSTNPTASYPHGITWTSRPEGIVSVTPILDNGALTKKAAVKGLKEGTATITVSIRGIEATYTVKVGHDFTIFVYGYGGDCTHEGWTQWKCSIPGCDKRSNEYSGYVHSFANPVTYPATCTSKGYTIQKCTNPACNKEVITNEVPATDHHFEVTVEKSCGVTVTTSRCITCGYTISEQSEGTSNHVWKTDAAGNEVYTVDKDATCISEGTESIHCTKCSAVKNTRSIPKVTQHKFDPWNTVTSASWDHEGLEERECSLCHIKESHVIEKRSNIPGGGGGSSATPSPSPSESPEPSPSESPSPSPEPGTTPEPGVTPAPSPVPVPVDPPKTNDGSGWSYDYDTGDYYYFVDGEPKANYWAKEEAASQWGFWYYVGSDGKLATGLQYIVNNNGTGWYFLQPDDANGCIGKMLTGWQWLGPEAGEGWFSTAHGGKNGQCTWTENWGDYDPTTGLWEDGLSHK